MREILFRAKSIEDNFWMFGFYCDGGYGDCDVPCILPSNGNQHVFWGIQIDTVGQYTGLTDKNGVKIFEGDIVEKFDDGERGLITYRDEEAMFCVEFDTWCTDFDHFYGKDFEVVGNIHDNPEFFSGATV